MIPLEGAVTETQERTGSNYVLGGTKTTGGDKLKAPADGESKIATVSGYRPETRDAKAVYTGEDAEDMIGEGSEDVLGDKEGTGSGVVMEGTKNKIL